VPEEPLAHEKLCPVLGVVRAESADRGIEAARAVVRLGGAGHSAAVHSRDPRVIMRFGTRVPVLRISVNAGNSTGSAGLDTNLAPSMTLGTGFVGRSSIGENLEPRHLVNWTRVAYNADASVPFDDFTTITAFQAPDGPVPGYPHASNLTGTGGGPAARPARHEATVPAGGAAVPDAVREQLRALIIEELQQLIKR
jgi:acetaldehyde dehydrogenase/alcohol dehydrogenase